MTNKVVRYGIVGIAVVLLVAVVFAGAASADKHIYTVEQWCSNVTSGFSGMSSSETIFLENDLNFSDCSSDIRISSLTAKIDGKNHTISNFSISRSGDRVGLVGTYSGRSISNLIISNFSVSGGYYVGGLVGYANVEIHIENVHVMYGNVSGGSYVGGLVGYAYSNNVYVNASCVNGCDISAGSEHVGGLVGYARFASVFVNASWVNGCDISVCSEYAGGLVGTASSTSVFVNASWVNGCDMSAGSSKVGGLVGCANYACTKIDIENSEVVDCIVKSSSGYSGGCLGWTGFGGSNNRIIDNCTVRNCVIYASSSSGSDPCGGIIGGCKLDGSPTVYPKVSNCTVEYCTIAGKGTNSVGGIAGTFPTAGTLDRNDVISSCIVSVSGKAAGICPTATTAS